MDVKAEKSGEKDIAKQPLQMLKGVGPRRAQKLAKCGLGTVWDAINYFPFRHEDRREVSPIEQAMDGDEVTVCGYVDSVASRKTRSRKSLVQVALRDDTDIMYGVWFNQPWMADKFKKGKKVIFSGTAKMDRMPSIMNPSWEIVPDDFDPAQYEGTVIPIYRLTEDISAHVMRTIIHSALDVALTEIIEYLPEEYRKKYSLMPLPDAYRIIHAYKTSAEELSDHNMARARRRLVCDEFFTIAMGLRISRHHSEQVPYTITYTEEPELTRQFIASLPYELTGAQKRVLREIKENLDAPRPMNRLLQGDVGSGKTVVALTAMLYAVENGYQAAFMAPTEVLAHQHYDTLCALSKNTNVHIQFLVGGLPAAVRREKIENIRDGAPQIIVGTHALIQKDVEIPNLALAIIDEQHKFGVAQRNALRDQQETGIDVLVMTATPIPRSLALTVYGDLTTSRIDELPGGRKPITTKVVTPSRLPKVWRFVREEAQRGRQTFVVYPLIDESDKLPLKAAAAMHEELSKKIFPDLRVGLVHGRLSAQEKESVMSAFAAGEIDILVATTVIEVGIDVPNATVMIIEEAQRFGLAQLHQLRGRIGRGGEKSYCILVDNSGGDAGARYARGDDRQQELLEYDEHSRLAVMEATQDGFRIAEEDLKMRGPGEFFGVEQTGLPALHIADIIKDEEDLKVSRFMAEEIFAERDALNAEIRASVRTRIKRAFGDDLRGVDAG